MANKTKNKTNNDKVMQDIAVFCLFLNLKASNLFAMLPTLTLKRCNG